MQIDILTQLNDFNSQRNQQTGEYILTVPVLELEGEYIINSKKNITITSKFQTILKCQKLIITTDKSVNINNISFEAKILVYNSSNVIFSNCSISNKSDNSNGALIFYNTQSASLSHVTVTNTANIPSVYIYNSKISASNLTISKGNESLFVCKNNSMVYLKDSTLNDTHANAIYCKESHLKIENCSIYNTEYPAIFSENSVAEISNNVIQNVSQNGISLTNCKDCKVVGNRLTRIKSSSINFIDCSTGIIQENQINEAGGNGIYLSNKSDATISRNQIQNTECPGIAIITNSKAIISENKITNAKHAGICARCASDVKIEDCDLSDIGESGISISDTENCTIVNNCISNCKANAIEAYNRSKVNFYGNKIMNIQGSVFYVFTSAFVKAENNKIEKIGNALFKVIFKGGGEFINNDVKNCTRQIDGQTSSQYFMLGNGEFKGATNIESRKSENVVFDDAKISDANILCLKCNRKQRDAVLIDCGHKVYCTECAEKALNNREKCPLCQFDILSIVRDLHLPSEMKCKLCGSNGHSCIITPCGHIPSGFCEKCIQRWYVNTQNCPVCVKSPSTYKVINE